MRKMIVLVLAAFCAAGGGSAVFAKKADKATSAPSAAAAPNNGLPVVEAPENNDGVYNAPLMTGGLKAENEGTKESLRMAIEDLIDSCGNHYPDGKTFLKRLEGIDDENSDAFLQLKREALLANPLLDFEKLLLVRSNAGNRFSRNWQTRASCVDLYDDALVLMPSLRKEKTEVIYKAPDGKFIGDVDLHFDGDRLLLTSNYRKMGENPIPEQPAKKQKTSKKNKKEKPELALNRQYGVFELLIDPNSGKAKGGPRKVTPDMGNDIDCYDACYLPNDEVIFASTASYEGVPCVGGSSYVANLYRMDRKSGKVRRLTFDQDGNWHPCVTPHGRVMYTRWEYTDSAHYFSRLLMHMNPDGTDQKCYYGSNSYWPNSMFFSRVIPGKGNSTKFVSVISGHHDTAKVGALCIFDAAKGRVEADGALQLLLGHGKPVEPLVVDSLAKKHYAPHFAHPYPLSEKYFLAASEGSVYLVDIFDNMLCLKAKDSEGSYYEPLPLRKVERPPVIPDRINLDNPNAIVLINSVYEGPGLAGVPRGTVKNLRVYRYEYGPRQKGGHYSMGMESGWDAKQILGTVPVEEDGSASFTIPANTPVAFQPLDKDGKSLQLMRSWTVGMPGEALSCVGCHESQNMAPLSSPAKAMQRRPSSLKPFYGEPRGYSFTREIQPVLDKYCLGCHDGKMDLKEGNFDKAGRYQVADHVVGTGEDCGKKFAESGLPDFSDPKTACRLLHPYVRRNGPEGDYHLLTPLEFHADTSELIQMLQKGHHNVKLDTESWEKLYAWIDLNAPFKGTWSEAGARPEILERRMELRQRYALDDFNPETIVNPYKRSPERVMPEKRRPQIVPAKPAVVKKSPQKRVELDLGEGMRMEVVSIPSGAFSMGSNDETPQEQPVSRVAVDKPFFMGATEVTLGQFRRFDPDYLNGVYDMHYKDQVHRGYYMNDMDLPVVRVSWEKAMAFCEWLSKKTGYKVSLPTEAQWEWACRAGTGTALSFGNLDADFSTYANMADITRQLMAVKGTNPKPIQNPNLTYDFELKDPRSDDNMLLLAEVGSYRPNAWGLYDMHGNAAEWTRSDYASYPYSADDGRNALSRDTKKVVRGGSFNDRPFRCTSSFRYGYPAWQRVYNTGFRIVVEQ